MAFLINPRRTWLRSPIGPEVMRIYLNDLSIDGGFRDREAVRASILAILAARQKSPALKRMLYCSSSLRSRVGWGEEILHVTFASFRRDERLSILEWLDRFGPFLETDRESEQNDLFWYEDIDVTDQGLGEATRRLVDGT